MRPLDGPANLIYFLYARRETEALWREQLEIVGNAIERFDGVRLLYMAADDEYFRTMKPVPDHGWDHIEFGDNDRERWELPGFQSQMQLMADRPGFTVRMHSKGVVRGTAEKHLDQWWRLAFKTILHVDAVRRSLDSAIITGPFRRFGFAHNLGVDWHYSGSFYAFRNAEIFAREWMPASRGDASHYVEAWPALVTDKSKSDCLRFDGVSDLYRADNWKAAP